MTLSHRRKCLGDEGEQVHIDRRPRVDIEHLYLYIGAFHILKTGFDGERSRFCFHVMTGPTTQNNHRFRQWVREDELLNEGFPEAEVSIHHYLPTAQSTSLAADGYMVQVVKLLAFVVELWYDEVGEHKVCRCLDARDRWNRPRVSNYCYDVRASA